MSTQQWWYTSRVAGLTAWGLTAASVIIGLLMTARLGVRSRLRWLLGAHQWASGIAVALTFVHVAALVPERHLDLSVAALLVPFASVWRPWAVTFGIVAFYLLIAVELTSLARSRLPRRWWRAVHLTSFGLFWLATLHTSMAGSDASGPAVIAVVNVTVFAVLFLVLARVLALLPTARRDARPSHAATTRIPGARGWARPPTKAG